MKRAKIYRQVISLLAGKKGDFSLDELALSLGIKKQSLYSYFNSKEELFNNSLSFCSSQLKIVSFNLDLSESTGEVIKSLLRHYLELFANKENRDYLSVVYSLKEYSYSNVLNLEDIKFTIENQLSFVLQELENRNKLKSHLELNSLAHLLMLVCFDLISVCDSKDKIEFELNKIESLLFSLIEI